MNKNNKLALLKNRQSILENRGNKNIKSGGVLRKIKRQIRNFEI